LKALKGLRIGGPWRLYNWRPLENDVKNMYFPKTPFSSWKPPKQTIESKTQQKNEIHENLVPEIRFLL
jgi:hypothetical protein